MAQFSPSETRRILAEHDAFVRAVARSLVRDENDVDDLIQDTWVALLRARPKLGSGLRPWLRRVVRNTALSRRRSKQRRTDREALAARSEERESGIESLSERLELNQQVVACVLELDEPYRAVVLLRYERGLSIEDIAENLSLPLETARTRLRRARQRLREKLERRLGGDGQNWAGILMPLAGIRPSPARDVLLAGAKTVAATAALTAVGMWAGARIAPAPTFEELGLTVTELEPAEQGPRAPRPGALEPVPAAELPASRGLAATTDSRSGRALRIVEGRGALPVAGARVWYADQTLWESDRLWTDAGPGERERLVKQRGTLLTADASGVAYLPRTEGWLQVYASAEGLWNHRQIEPCATEPLELELIRDRTLLVEVIDEDGRPRPGVSVTLGPGWNVLSGDGGLARFEHVDARQRFSPEGRQRLVGFGFPHVGGTAVPIELEDLPAEPVRLVLPPTGGLLVRLVDQHGAPYVGRCHVQVRALGGDGVPGGPFAVCSVSGSASERPFTHVALDCRFAISAFPSCAPAVRFEHSGPGEPGETVEVVARVEPADRTARVSGRLSDAVHRPVAGRDVFVHYEARGSSATRTGSAVVQTDADGGFELETEAAETVALSFRLPAGGGRPAMVAEVEAPCERDARTIDVGQVRMWDLPRVAAGRVVDAAGEAVAGATVRLVRASANVGGPLTKAQRVANAGDDGSIRRVVTANDGSFAIFDELEAGRYALSAAARRSRLSSSRQLLEYGGLRPIEGLELVLRDRPVGSLEGWLVLPPGVHASRVLVAIEGSGGTEPGSIEASRRSCSPAPSGRFRLEQLDAGEVTLQIWIEGWQRPALEIEGLEIVAGVVSTDPRLEGLALDRVVHAIPCEISDLDGAPIAVGEVRYGRVGGELGFAVGFHDGRVRLLSPTPLVDAEVAAPGAETVRYANVGARDRLTLGPGRDFLLRLRQESVIPTGTRLVLSVWAVEAGAREDASPRAPTTTRTVGPDGQVPVTLPHVGSWLLEWQLEPLGDTHGARRFVARETVELTRDHLGRPVLVGPPAEALEGALSD